MNSDLSIGRLGAAGSGVGLRMQPGCSKRSSNEAAGEKEPEAYPLGYVEDSFDPRTTLGAFFSSMLVVGLGVARKLALLDFFLVAPERLQRIRLEMGIGFDKLRHELIEQSEEVIED